VPPFGPPPPTYHIQAGAYVATIIEANFVDESAFKVSGRVLLAYTAEHRPGGKNPCTLPNVEICPFEIGGGKMATPACATSDSTGYYEIALTIGSNVELRASFALKDRDNTTYTATDIRIQGASSTGVVFLNLMEDQPGQNFEVYDIFKTTISFAGGKCRLPLGGERYQTKVKITMKDNFCSGYVQEVTFTGTTVTLDMPLADFNVKLVDNYGIQEQIDGRQIGFPGTRNQRADIFEYMSDTDNQDVMIYTAEAEAIKGLVNKPNTTDFPPTVAVTFTYYAKLDFEVLVGDNVVYQHVEGAEPWGYKKVGGSYPLAEGRDGWKDHFGRAYIVKSNEFVNVTVYGSETYGKETCHLVGDKKITFSDQVTGIAYACNNYPLACDVTLEAMDDGEQMRTGSITTIAPSVENGPYGRLIVGYDDPYRSDYRFETAVIILGARKLGNSYSVTVAEGNPITILYDPPGSGSFSALTKSTTFTSTVTTTTSDEQAKSAGVEASLGWDIDIDTCVGMGASICKALTKVSGEVGYSTSYESAKGGGTSKDWSSSFTQTTAIATSDDVQGPGRDSDVVLTAALALIYEETMQYELEIIETGLPTDKCKVISRPTITWQANLKGYAFKTIWAIENEVIPNLEKTMKTNQQMIDDIESGKEAATNAQKQKFIEQQQVNNAGKNTTKCYLTELPIGKTLMPIWLMEFLTSW